MPHRDVIVIGTSEGGLDALKTIMASLPGTLSASVFIVQHLPAHSPSHLASLLSLVSTLPVQPAKHHGAIQPGTVTVAIPDYHLMIAHGQTLLTKGPRENRSRPAIDPLFRTAAEEFGQRVIGVILTGALDDGTAGLHDIKRRGGLAVAQNPIDAVNPQMPQNAIDHVEIDKIAPLHQIGGLLAELVDHQVAAPTAVHDQDAVEAAMNTNERSTIEQVETIGEQVSLSCPDCGGPLWQLQDKPMPHFRCHTGHAFGTHSLISGLSEATEKALWAALRTMDERTRMLERLATQHHSRNHQLLATEM